MLNENVTFWIKAVILAVVASFVLHMIDGYRASGKVYQLPLKINQSSDSSTQNYPVPLEQRRAWCKGNRECRKMAEALVYEARGEPLAGAVAVAFVIKQRAESRRWPNSISGVIEYRCHFSYTCEPPQYNKPSQKDWDRAYVVGYDVLNGKIENNVKKADHYLNPKNVKRMPRWTKEYEYVATIGNHKFYRSN